MRISDWSSDVCSSDLLHLERKILFHGHEALDTDTTPTLEGEYWLMHNHFAQAEGVANLDKVPEAGALIAIGFAKPLGGVGGYARYIAIAPADWPHGVRSEEHTSELQSLMRISYAVFCLKKKNRRPNS